MQPRQKLIPLRVAAPLTLGAAILGSMLGFGVVSALQTKPAPADPTLGSTAASATAAALHPSAEPAADAAPADPAAGDAAQTTDAGQTTDAARASDAARATDAATDAGPAGGDVDLSDAGLKPYEAYLFVRSGTAADVWVQGKNIGRTNQKLKLVCSKGLRYTRLGQEPGPAWISNPTSILIPCGSVTQITLEASEQRANAAPTEAKQPQPQASKPLPTGKISKDNPY